MPKNKLDELRDFLGIQELIYIPMGIVFWVLVFYAGHKLTESGAKGIICSVSPSGEISITIDGFWARQYFKSNLKENKTFSCSKT